LIEILKVSYQKRDYLELGYASLCRYIQDELGHRGGSGSRRARAAEVACDIPDLIEKLQQEVVSLDSVSRLGKFFKDERYKGKGALSLQKKREVFKSIEGKTEEETFNILRKQSTVDFPSNDDAEETPLPTGKTLLEFEISEGSAKDLKEVKFALSHQIPDMDTGKVFEYLIRDFLKRRENQSEALQIMPVGDRLANSELRAKKLREADYQCTYKDKVTLKRCDSRYQPEIDHKIPYSKGGQTTPKNTQVLCRAHNRWKGTRILQMN